MRRRLPSIALATGLGVAGPLSAADVPVRPDDLAIAGLEMIHADCARAFPDLATETAPAFASWRERNREAFARLEGNREFANQLREDRARIESGKGDLDKGAQRQMRDYCEAFLAASFETPGPRLAPETPIAAWSGLIEAMRAGDARKAIAYFAPGARGRYREVLNALGPDGLKKAAGDFNPIEKYETMNDIAFAYTTRVEKDGLKHAFEISFMRDPRTGGWFIESM